jgi:hypothetical protein
LVQADIIKLQNAVAINRDEAAYRQLFINFHQPLIKFGFSIIQSEETAEDLYSEVMIKIWLMDESLAKIENLKQYLYTLIRNAAFNVDIPGGLTRLFRALWSTELCRQLGKSELIINMVKVFRN